jgi:hypothetical protein
MNKLDQNVGQAKVDFMVNSAQLKAIQSQPGVFFSIQEVAGNSMPSAIQK